MARTYARFDAVLIAMRRLGGLACRGWRGCCCVSNPTFLPWRLACDESAAAEECFSAGRQYGHGGGSMLELGGSRSSFGDERFLLSRD
jgi:hypothetical protein